jgi:type IV pilus assembly protein PilA
MKRMNDKGFTLVEIMIVVAIIALLAAIAIPNLLRAKISANEALAQSTLRSLSTAAESFYTANDGVYPASEAELLAGDPPYLNSALCGIKKSGYTVTCPAWGSTYSFVATPGSTTEGKNTYTITPGGKLVSAATVF